MQPPQILTMPSVANKNFPYHVRTTQIGIMELTGSLGPNTMDRFGHSIYEPRATVTETVIIPLTRRTEEIFETMYAQRVLNGNAPTTVNLETNVDGRDTAMENVLNWSTARNPAALEETRDRLGSFYSSKASSRRTSYNFEATNERQPQYSFEDYVRDVPVELFTVSKMVIAAGSDKVDGERDNQENK